MEKDEETYWEKKVKLDATRNTYMLLTVIFTCITAIGAIACLFL